MIIFLLLIFGVQVDMDLGLWRDRDRVIEWDVHSYYAYLPALFIYDDIRLEHEYRFDDDYFLFWPNYTASGKPIIKMTMGVAVFYSPFFFVGHLLAKVMGYPADGWSPPYKILLLIGGLCYFLIGLLAVRRILERTGFSDTVIAIVIVWSVAEQICSVMQRTLGRCHMFTRSH
ncbi:MAG: hypothetical protein IPI00_09770 [Flavobacteriales bacterium]|nr:hypothetical protein [Flavobacteriales bacterium]